MSFRAFRKYTNAVACYDVKDQLKNHIYERYCESLEAGHTAKGEILSTERLESYRAKIREKFLEGIGGLPEADAPLNARVVSIVPKEHFRIENILFCSRREVYISGNLYVPNSLPDTGKAPAVLFLSGHSENARLSPEYQNVCQRLVLAGIVVFAIDPVGQGERFSYLGENGEALIPPCCDEHDYAGVQVLLAGQSLARYFIHDAIRAIDYLSDRPEVDRSRIGVTGNSGGGTQTSMVMICDDRIAAAAPATFITSRKAILLSGQPQDSEQIWPDSAAYGLDHDDILMMMAPKPVLLLCARYDFFPLEGTVDTYAKGKAYWELYGQAENLSMFVDDCHHTYSDTMAVKAAEFFRDVFNLTVEAIHKGPQLLPAKELQATLCGQIRMEIKESRTVFDENFTEVNTLYDKRKSTDDGKLRENALHWLEEKVFGSRKTCLPYVNHMEYWGGGREQELSHCFSMWWSQKGLKSAAVTVRNTANKGRKLPVTLALWENGICDIESHTEFVRKICSMNRAVMVLDVSGYGSLQPNEINPGNVYEQYGTLYTLSNDLFCLSDSLMALRVYEVCRAIDVIISDFNDLDAEDIHIHSFNKLNPVGLIASFIDERVTESFQDGILKNFSAIASEKFYDHSDIFSRVLPGVLKYFDLDDLQRWIKNRRNGDKDGDQNIR